jgi:hypothetical protein
MCHEICTTRTSLVVPSLHPPLLQVCTADALLRTHYGQSLVLSTAQTFHYFVDPAGAASTLLSPKRYVTLPAFADESLAWGAQAAEVVARTAAAAGHSSSNSSSNSSNNNIEPIMQLCCAVVNSSQVVFGILLPHFLVLLVEELSQVYFLQHQHQQRLQLQLQHHQHNPHNPHHRHQQQQLQHQQQQQQRGRGAGNPFPQQAAQGLLARLRGWFAYFLATLWLLLPVILAAGLAAVIVYFGIMFAWIVALIVHGV